MKHFNKILLAIALIMSVWQAKAQIPVPTVYTNLSSGDQTFTDTIKTADKWYKWHGDSVVQVVSHLLKAGYSSEVDTTQLYIYNGTDLTLLSRDSLHVDSVSVLYAGYFNNNSTLYLHIITGASSCTACVNSYPILEIHLANTFGTCSPVTSCDIVNNGGFENVNPNDPCDQNVGNVVNCWTGYEGTADAFKRYCNSNGGNFNLNANTWSSIPSINSHNGTPNNVVMGCVSFYEPSFGYKADESVQSLLNTPLIAGQVYKLSIWAYNFQGFMDNHNYNTGGHPLIFTVAGSNNTATSGQTNPSLTTFPTSVTPIANFSLTAVNTWSLCTTTFTFGGSPLNNILIGPNVYLSAAAHYQGDSDPREYFAFDDVSITRIYTPTLTAIANPNGICAGQSTTLTASSSTYTFASSSYTWMPGAIAGSNVVVSPSVTTVYTVTGTDICGMTSLPYTVTVSVVANPTITATASPTLTCPGSAVSLSGSGGLTFSYVWQPGGQTGASITATVTAPTVYTVTGQNLSGCYGSGTVAVNVYTTTINTSPSPTICIGGTATLSATTNIPGSTFDVWQPGGLSGSSVSVTPTVTTVYTVTTSNLLGDCISTRTATITVNNFASLSASPSTICAGSSATLSASGASTYTWNPGNLPGPTVVVTPTVTTTYTIGGTIPACGFAHDVVTVTVLTASNISVSVSSSNQHPCLGTSMTLTASVLPAGTYTYSWASPLSGSSSTISTTPTDNYVYTCNVTDICGNTAHGSACVSVVCDRCCTSAETMSNYTITTHGTYSAIDGVPYDLIGTITIAGNVTWANTDFRLQSGSRIVIQAGGSLTLSNCKLFSCQDLWEGITVQCNGTSSGSLTVNNGTSIEDAYRAIYYDGLNTAYPGNIIVTGADLNKNYIGVSTNNIGASGAGTSTGFEYSTYRTIASTSSPGGNLKCSSFYTPTIRPRGYIGWQANNQLEEIIIGPVLSPTTTISNAFDKLDYGYYGTNAITRIHFCSFSNMTGDNTLIIPPPTTPGLGIGVYATATNTTATYVTGIYENTFTNMWRGVETKAIDRINVNGNTFTNTTTSPGTCSSGCVGNAGVYLTNTHQFVQADGNVISNCFVAAGAYYSQVVPASTFSMGIGTNTISATGTGTVQYGVDLEDAVNTFSTAGAVMQIAANTTSNVRNGIYVLNVKNGLRISGNTLGILYTSSVTQAGIKLNGAQNVTVDNNTATSTNTANVNLRGIYLQSSPGCLTQCNTVNTFGQGFVFEGNCLTTTAGFVNNTINNAYDGLVLKTNGVIGQQGMNGNPFTRKAAGNQWTGSFNRSKTIVYDLGSSAQNSNILVRNTTAENPLPQTLNIVLSGGTAVLATDNYGIYPAVNPGTTYTVSYALNTCPTTLTVALKQAQTENLTPAQQIMNDQVEAQQADTGLYNLIQALDPQAILKNETEAQRSNYVYGLMDRGYTTQHAGLNAFYQANLSSSMNNYSHIDQLVLSADLATAQSANAAAPVTSTIEQNSQLLNTALLNYLQDPTYPFSQAEINDLMTLANKCPLAEGNAVYQSRALLSVILDAHLDYAEACDGEVVEKTTKNDKGLGLHQDSYLLFPNPNNGMMTLAYTMQQNARFTVYDLQGRIVYKQDLTAAVNMVHFSLENLSQGVYHYTIVQDNGVMAKTDKLVIIK